MFRKISFCNFNLKKDLDLNSKLLLLATSLGMYSIRDKERSMYRIFLELYKHNIFDEGLRSEEIAKYTNLSRGTVVFHLNKMIDSGYVIQKQNQYFLKEQELSKLITDIKKDMDNFLNQVQENAKEIDLQMHELIKTNFKNGNKKRNRDIYLEAEKF